MQYPTLLQFAADYPWTACFLSLPTSLFLIAVAWSVATLLTNVFSVFLSFWVQLMTALMVVVRGYPPKMEDGPLTLPTDDKPLAS
jgi:hypothetical protein